MRIWRLGTAIGGWLAAWMLILSVPAHATYLGAYDYPFVNPLLATVASTPVGYRADLPPIDAAREVTLLKVRPFPDREPPPVLWYQKDLEYALFRQHPGPAPLAFVIAGTGAGWSADKSVILIRAMLKAGFNVVSLSNPTFTNFIATASTTMVPGNLADDAADLYRVIQMALPQVRSRVAVTDIYLAGYSLGAAHAAYLARLDDQQRKVGFKKVLMVNPPVSLYGSMRRLDDMLDYYVARDPQAVSRFVDQTFQGLARVYSTSERAELTGDFLFRAFLALKPTREDLEQLIGLAFRLTANDLAFTSDVMNRFGYVVPPEARLTATSSLTPFLVRGLGLSFDNFFEGVYFPFFNARDRGATRQSMIDAASLRPVEDYLRHAGKVGLIGSEDDVILGPGEIDYLEQLFGERAWIFPTGGHCGAMDQRDVVAAMIRFMQQ